MKIDNRDNQITEKQLYYIEILMEKADMGRMEILKKCSEIRGSNVSYYSDLTKKEASELIGYLRTYLGEE